MWPNCQFPEKEQKEHKKYKGNLSTWRITSKPELVYAYKCHAYKKTCTLNSFVALPRLRATAVDCAVDYVFFLFLTFGRTL